ncbi:MAG: hypothetical protein AB1472_03800 [Candidatus Omnitrophota bacterium]
MKVLERHDTEGWYFYREDICEDYEEEETEESRINMTQPTAWGEK